MEAEQAQHLAAVQETMKELGDDMLSAFEMPGDHLEMAMHRDSLAKVESEVRSRSLALFLPCASLTQFRADCTLQLERTQSAVLTLHAETASVLPRVTRTPGRGGARATSGAVDSRARRTAAVHPADRSAGPKVTTTVKPVVRHGKSVATATASKETVAAAHDGEIGKRLQQAGAVVGAITCSLVWDNTDVRCPDIINFLLRPALVSSDKGIFV